jgi:hypothetical protein
MKKLITPINIAIFFWGLILIAISQLYPDYTRYYLYLSIAVIVPVTIVNLVKEKKKTSLIIQKTLNFQFTECYLWLLFFVFSFL